MYTSKTLTIDAFKENTPIDSKTPKLIRKSHIRNIIQNHLSVQGYNLEFGVHKGETVNYIARLLPNENVYGFDSFEGLPENWYKNSKEDISFSVGTFKLNKLPTVEDNVKLIQGRYNKSLPKWLSNNTDQIKLLHLDSDLYSSTIYVLEELNKFIIPGTVIIFDELYPFNGEENYLLWQDGEWKALIEWMEKFNRMIEIISRTSHQQAAIKVVN